MTHLGVVVMFESGGVVLPFALWLGELRKRREQRNKADWSAFNRALDLAAADSVDQRSDDEQSVHSRESEQQIRKRIRHPSRANRNKESEPPPDSSGGGGDV